MSKEVITKAEDIKDTKVEESSTIKEMREAIKTKDAELKNLKNNSVDKKELDTLKEKVQRMEVEKTFGSDNVDEATKLVNAGFDEERIKELLTPTNVGAGKFQLTEEELILKKAKQEEEEEEETEEEKLARMFEEAKAENKKNQL